MPPSPAAAPPAGGRRRVARAAAALALASAVAGGAAARDQVAPPEARHAAGRRAAHGTQRAEVLRSDPLPGMPPLLDAHDVYAADRPGRLSRAVRRFPARVYVPNGRSDTVVVIDARTYRPVGRFKVGRQPQHVTPSWDLRTLWVGNNQSNTLTAIDPAKGRPVRTVKVDDPYNLYFTPDGRRAIVVAEALRHALPVPCEGVDHLDFSADGRYLLASCEFSGELLQVDVAREQLVRVVPLRAGAMPQDVKLAPDGSVFYVADLTGGVWVVDAARPRVLGFVRTGKGAHGLYASRDARILYVSNRSDASISLISFATSKVVATWRLPGGGSPDMGGVSADGRVLWLSGRYNREVYAIDTRNGRLLARIPVGAGPHGLCVYPQPGRYSLGHTGVFR